jgi:glycerophosphoryl diester phosphodiesterase
MKRVKLAAHRGYMEKYPENTITGYKAALRYDIDQVEIDLHMTSDGEIIMMHDHTIDRTTNGTGWIKDKTLAEMRELDAGAYKGEEFKGEKVPLFTEYLDLMQNYPDIETNVEIKEYPENNERWQEAVDKIIALIEKYDVSKKIYINTW